MVAFVVTMHTDKLHNGQRMVHVCKPVSTTCQVGGSSPRLEAR